MIKLIPFLLLIIISNVYAEVLSVNLPDGIYDANYAETIKATIIDNEMAKKIINDKEELDGIGLVYTGRITKIVKVKEFIYFFHDRNKLTNGLPDIRLFTIKKTINDSAGQNNNGQKYLGEYRSLFNNEDEVMIGNYEYFKLTNNRLVIECGKNGSGETIYSVYDYRKLTDELKSPNQSLKGRM